MPAQTTVEEALAAAARRAREARAPVPAGAQHRPLERAPLEQLQQVRTARPMEVGVQRRNPFARADVRCADSRVGPTSGASRIAEGGNGGDRAPSLSLARVAAVRPIGPRRTLPLLNAGVPKSSKGKEKSRKSPSVRGSATLGMAVPSAAELRKRGPRRVRKREHDNLYQHYLDCDPSMDASTVFGAGDGGAAFGLGESCGARDDATSVAESAGAGDDLRWELMGAKTL